jgi:hypothetical protein
MQQLASVYPPLHSRGVAGKGEEEQKSAGNWIQLQLVEYCFDFLTVHDSGSLTNDHVN